MSTLKLIFQNPSIIHLYKSIFAQTRLSNKSALKRFYQPALSLWSTFMSPEHK